MLERRRTQRESWHQVIELSLITTDLGEEKIEHIQVTATNIGGHGIGIKTAYPLEPGHVVRLGHDIRGHRVGVIIHSRKEERTYAAGMAFK